MDDFQKRGKIVLGLAVVLMLVGCWGPEADCNSADTRASVIKTVSADTNNPLVKYAADQSEAVKNKLSQAKTDAEKSSILEEAVRGASYRLSERMITNSKSKIKGKVSCSGMMNATVITAERVSVRHGARDIVRAGAAGWSTASIAISSEFIDFSDIGKRSVIGGGYVCGR